MKIRFQGENRLQLLQLHYQKICVIVADERYNINEIDTICREIRTQLEIDLTVGVGACYSLSQIHQSFDESVEALKYRKIYGTNVLYEYEKLNNLAAREFQNASLKEVLKEINQCIKIGDENALANLLARYLKTDSTDLVQCQTKAIEIMSEILRACGELGIQNSCFSELDHAYNEILMQHSIQDLLALLANKSLYTIHQIRELRSKKNRSLIAKVKKYIEIHMAEADLNMAEVSAHFFINQSFLSRIFRQEEKITLIDYLSAIRIKKRWSWQRQLICVCIRLQVRWEYRTRIISANALKKLPEFPLANIRSR